MVPPDALRIDRAPLKDVARLAFSRSTQTEDERMKLKIKQSAKQTVRKPVPCNTLVY
jgi:hypothetical protein